AALVLASLGLRTRNNSNIKKSEVNAVHHETTDLASKEDLMYPQLWQMHEASYLTSKEEVQDWKAREIVRKKSELDVKILDRIQLLPEDYRNEPNLSKVILLRGSSRRFSRKSISFLQLCNILHSCTKGVPLDFTKYGKDSLIDIYLIANDVVGLPRGGYFYNNNLSTLDQLNKNVSRDVSGYLCLWQSLFSDASVVFFLMTSLEQVLKEFGNRGYRGAQFEAGMIAGKIYLSSYAQEIGASGSTFFDDAVTQFFSPHAQGKSTMIAVGV